MCGRFGLTRPERLDLKRFGIASLPDLEPRYNIPPGSDVLVIRMKDDERVADLVHWGLIPSWAKDPTIGNRMANARADTAFEKPSFRNAIKSRRCLIPADVFYEWKVVPGQTRKQPHAIRMKDGSVFGLAGIWEYWRPKDGGDGIVSCSVLTTDANALMAGIHDRMPVIIPPDRYRTWLDPKAALPAIQDLLLPYDDEPMEAWPIGLRVNNPKADDEQVLERQGIGDRE